MSADTPTPYNGTVTAEIPLTDTASATKEFYRLPLKTVNEITVSVKASNDASILLFDGSKSSDASNIKVEVVLGSDKNSTVSVGLQNDDGTSKYPKQLIGKDSALSATHFKVFTIRWYKGRVMVYNHGFKKPFVTWDGPPESLFSSVGIRTLGCSGDWIVQGAPVLTTADSKEFKEIVINSGRLDYEVESYRDAYVLLTPEAEWSRNPIVHVILGAWGSMKRSGIWWNFGEVAAVEEADFPVVQNEYRRFWIKWDAYNILVGHGGKDAPFLRYNSGATPLSQLNYISLQGHVLSFYVRYHILDQVREEDTAKPGDQTQQQSGSDASSVGYVVYNYQVKD